MKVSIQAESIDTLPITIIMTCTGAELGALADQINKGDNSHYGILGRLLETLKKAQVTHKQTVTMIVTKDDV